MAFSSVTGEIGRVRTFSGTPRSNRPKGVADGLRDLDQTERQVILMRYFEGRSREATAQALGYGSSEIAAIECGARKALSHVFAA